MSDRHKLWHRRGYLPHFDGAEALQTITFRLVDSLPREICEHLANSVTDPQERYAKTETIIDQGRGSCALKERTNAQIVQDALQHFDGSRYRLIAWVVMPNHVHAMIEQMHAHRLGDIVHSWKRFTANQINRRQGTKGPVWAVDYFDRYVRDAEHFESVVSYIEYNPVKAGLVRHPGDWIFSSYRIRRHD